MSGTVTVGPMLTMALLAGWRVELAADDCGCPIVLPPVDPAAFDPAAVPFRTDHTPDCKEECS